MSTETKKSLVPKLRFPEFLSTQEWKFEKVDALVNTVTPPKKLPTSSYKANGKFPIVDQSQSDICGWTDDHEALIKDALPVIVFGDHTCVLKLVTQPFAQGADGIKILKPKSVVGTSYLYQYLNYRPVVTEEYKRHYSILKEKQVLFPDIKTGEQQKIADCLSSLDELIAAQGRKVEALKTHKKGLMQQLFPREGETQPRLRFTEFQSAVGWEKTAMGDCLEKVIDYRGKPPPKAETGVPLITAKNVRFGWLDMTSDEYIEADAYGEWMTKGIPKVGDILFTTEAPLGNVAMFPKVGKFALGQRIITLRCKASKCVPEFLFQSLLGPEMQAAIDFHSTGSTAKGIKSSVFVNLGFRLPTVVEQHRIAESLASLDDLITAANQELDTYKTHKHGLIQQLFPSAEVDS